jgi:hypothetical protein
VRQRSTLSAAFALLLLAFAGSAAATDVFVGVNVVGVQQMNAQQQDALIAQLRQDGVTVVRMGIGARFTRFITQAYANGIGVVAIVYPTEGSASAHVRPADPSFGLQWAEPSLADADPVKFRAWLATQLEPLEAVGVHLTALELGNEINGPYFNGDFLPAQASGRVLDLSDLTNPNDPEGRAIAAGYKSYLRILAALKDVRDHSTANRTTPILSAGLADGGLPGKKPGQKLDGVSIPATLEFFRQNGIDKIVDGYAVHVYPSGNPSLTVSQRIETLNKDAFALCTSAKPCWLTEWGFNNNDKSCPIDDAKRVQLFAAMRGALGQFARQGRLAASIYFSWGGQSGEAGSTIFRCGALTEAGKLALDPL